MYFLYLDASGDPGWPPPGGKSKTNWYVLAGLCLEESKWIPARTAAKKVVEKYFPTPTPPPRELRYSSLRAGQKPYDTLTAANRGALADGVFAALRGLEPVIFAIAIDKRAHQARSGTRAFPPDSWAIQLLCPRFHRFLERKQAYGALMMDAEERRKDGRLWTTVERGRKSGIVIPAGPASPFVRSNTTLDRFVENVLFLKSDDSHLIQFADFCSGAVWTHFELGDSARFNELSPFFDGVGSTVYGLKKWPP